MNPTKSPNALAARGASESEIDSLGQLVVSDANRQQQFSQAPILATLTGSDRCEAEGVSAHGHAPVLELCRELIAAGFNPASPLEAWRGQTLCLRVRSIGEGARLTVTDDRHGTPRLRLRQERPQGYVAGSPVAPIGDRREYTYPNRGRRPSGRPCHTQRLHRPAHAAPRRCASATASPNRNRRIGQHLL
jgi:hypothetical protein